MMVSPSNSPSNIDVKAARVRKGFFRSFSPTLIPSPIRQVLSSQAAADRQREELDQLNEELEALAVVFPNVRPEVFREMLGTFSGESRSYLVADQLLKHKEGWVKDRWRISLKGRRSTNIREIFEVEDEGVDRGDDTDQELVAPTERFRSMNYKKAVMNSLCQEFKSLSKSTVVGVLAEQNYSYTLSRPILVGLAAKSWRFSFTSFLSRWNTSGATLSGSASGMTAPKPHYMLLVNPWDDGSLPSLRKTGNSELDQELEETLLAPLILQIEQQREEQSLRLATSLNESESAAADALFECQCCMNDITFEALAVCSIGEHIVCFGCIQRAVSEALYGQSWTLNIDHRRNQVACLALTTGESCKGCIPQELAHRAVLAMKGGNQVWQSLSDRINETALRPMKSDPGSPLTPCPFCPYVEVSDLYLPGNLLYYRLNLDHPVLTLILLMFTMNLVPLFLVYVFLSFLLPAVFDSMTKLLAKGFRALERKTHLSRRFRCRSPGCQRSSCLTCGKAWRDPHTCYESATLSLRTTIEAARTAALKRTCPRCGVSFVKDSGCNKMVCVCGYTMCYICRQGLGNSKSGALNNLRPALNPVEAPEEGEGYRHFCQHFRPLGGRCKECDRCDLYRGENEDEIVKRAGEKAEKEWVVREGFDRSTAKNIKVGTNPSMGEYSSSGSETWLQGIANWWVESVFKC